MKITPLSTVYRSRDFVTPKEQITATIKELQTFANNFCKSTWNLDAPEIKVNNRLRTSLGRYVYNNYHGYSYIELNGKQVALEGQFHCNILETVVMHELTHYAMHTLGKPFNDGDREFENELLRVGASSSSAVKDKAGNHAPMNASYHITDTVKLTNTRTGKETTTEVPGNQGLKYDGKRANWNHENVYVSFVSQTVNLVTPD